jgi:sulfur relay (sulfurtransferase) DsrC/TusE family protein
LKKKPKKKKTSSFLTISIALVLVGIVVFYFYSSDQAKIRGFEFGNEIQSLQEEVQTEQGQFISSIAKWNEDAISNDEMIRIGEKHLETFNNLLKKYDELQPPDAFSRSVKLLKLSLEYQIESHEYRLEWIKTGNDSEWIRSQELTQLSFEAEQAGLKSFNDAKAGIEQ